MTPLWVTGIWITGVWIAGIGSLVAAVRVGAYAVRRLRRTPEEEEAVTMEEISWPMLASAFLMLMFVGITLLYAAMKGPLGGPEDHVPTLYQDPFP